VVFSYASQLTNIVLSDLRYIVSKRVMNKTNMYEPLRQFQCSRHLGGNQHLIHASDKKYDVPTVPSNKPPFKQNFMFDVPEASVPAVEMCWLISEAGIKTSAKDTE
jgi:hypothetical protein